MDWFERLMGFRENGYDDTRRQLEVVGDRLRVPRSSPILARPGVRRSPATLRVNPC